MTLADTLSRLPNPKDKGAVELDLMVDGIEMTTAEVHRCDIDLVNFSRRKQHQLRDQTARDPTMNAFMETTVVGFETQVLCTGVVLLRHAFSLVKLLFVFPHTLD